MALPARAQRLACDGLATAWRLHFLSPWPRGYARVFDFPETAPMSWPLASDFQTILQNPKIAFRDPYLRSCSIERDPCGQPRAWAGSFAVVYKGINPAGNPIAIRVFSTESPRRRGRYEQIGEHLTSRQLACLVSFEYREAEIRSLSDGNRYPIVLMD